MENEEGFFQRKLEKMFLTDEEREFIEDYDALNKKSLILRLEAHDQIERMKAPMEEIDKEILREAYRENYKQLKELEAKMKPMEKRAEEINSKRIGLN